MTRCADLCHVPLDHIDVAEDEIASQALADLIAAGIVVTAPPRDESPTGVGWPGITPKLRPAPTPEPCQVCGSRGCRR